MHGITQSCMVAWLDDPPCVHDCMVSSAASDCKGATRFLESKGQARFLGSPDAPRRDPVFGFYPVARQDARPGFWGLSCHRDRITSDGVRPGFWEDRQSIPIGRINVYMCVSGPSRTGGLPFPFVLWEGFLWLRASVGRVGDGRLTDSLCDYGWSSDRLLLRIYPLAARLLCLPSSPVGFSVSRAFFASCLLALSMGFRTGT